MTPAIRALVRLAYLDPDQAARQARKEGLYGAMLDHMQKVHKRLIYQYRKDLALVVLKTYRWKF